MFTLKIKENPTTGLFRVLWNDEEVGFFFKNESGRYMVPDLRGKGYSTPYEAAMKVIEAKITIVEEDKE